MSDKRIEELAEEIRWCRITLGCHNDVHQELRERIAKLEEAVKNLEHNFSVLMDLNGFTHPSTPTCKTCKDRGVIYPGLNYEPSIPCPDCAKKPICENCNGKGYISQTRFPSHKEIHVPCARCAPKWSDDRIEGNKIIMGGSAPKTSCTCGESTVIHREKPYPCYQAEPKTSCAHPHVQGDSGGGICTRCGEAVKTYADPQPERTPTEQYSLGHGNGFIFGKKQATEELRKKFDEVTSGYSGPLGSVFDKLRSKLFNG